jgi:hypothetical protein
VAEPSIITHHVTQSGHDCWALETPNLGNSREYRIVVLTNRTLYLASYHTKGGYDQALERLAKSTDILNDLGTQKLGKRRHEIPLDCIDRLEAFPFACEFKLRYTVDGVTRHVQIRTPPDEYYQQLFDTLRDKAARGEEVRDEPASAFRISIGPLVGMVATIGLGALLYWLAVSIAAGNPPEIKGGGKGQAIGLLLVWIAELLGPTGVVIAAALAFAAFFAWLAQRINDRPQRRVVDVRPY